MPGAGAAAPRGAGDDAPVVLETQALDKRFGGIHATQEVSIALRKGARHALIGPNGAGKTTLVNLLTGLLPPSGGRILLDGDDITDLAPDARVRRGLVRTFQINQLFETLTPLQTLTLVLAQRDGKGTGWWKPLASHAAQVDEAVALLHKLRLGDVMGTQTRVLAYGKRRLLEIAIALASRPRVLLLDEPVAGVPATESRELLDTLAELPADVTVLLIEHDMDIVFRFATRMTVLVNGGVLREGAPDDIASDPEVKLVYLGDSRRA